MRVCMRVCVCACVRVCVCVCVCVCVLSLSFLSILFLDLFVVVFLFLFYQGYYSPSVEAVSFVPCDAVNKCARVATAAPNASSALSPHVKRG